MAPLGSNLQERPHSGGNDTADSSAAQRWNPSRWLRLRTQPHVPTDPGRAGLRRAARAALVVPAAFAFAQLVLGSAQLTTFAVFGCFTLLVTADLGGRRRPRALAYAAATGIGAVLIALGTLASGSPWVGALAMLCVGFVVSFAGVFGGYAAAAQTALLLAFVLAVSIPVAPAALTPRLGGWLLAGMVSSVASVLLWPRFEQVALRQQVAAACRAVARLIQAQRSRARSADAAQVQMQVQQVASAAQVAVSSAREAYAATPKRPAGPARRDRAFVELLSELERIVEFATRPPPPRSRLSAEHPCLREGDRLAVTVVQTLAASAAVLTGGPPPDVQGLQAVLRAHRAALDRWAHEELRAGSAPEDVLDGLEVDDSLRVLAYLTLALGSNAALAAGAHVDTHVGVGTAANESRAEIPLRAGVVGFILRIGQTIRTQLALTSSVLHNSLRVALGLALAVLIARLFRLDHAFWVVLGTLSALRCNALATGRTTLQALTGTLIGFVIGAALLLLVDTGFAVLWGVLPIAVFLAAYAASAAGFVAGQAAFTVVVLILFNLIAPAGWRLGVARLEDVAVGAGISVIVGVLLWPRGARGELRTALADLYRAVADRLADAFGRILEPDGAGFAGPAQGETQGRAVAARERAGEALDQYLREQRGAKLLTPESAGSLVAAGTDAIFAAELLDLLAAMGYQVQTPTQAAGSDGVATLIGQVQVLVAMYVRLADQLDGAADATAQQMGISQAAVQAAALSSLQRWSQDPEAGHTAIAVVVAGEWVEQLGALAVRLEEPIAATAAAAREPWWR